MLQNLKTDIIYYKTNTDFEMEFNLCGCCRMRLLTDKASDQKTLVHDLARAVSRSRVIIIAGKLLGDEGVIAMTAKSIAKALTEIDKSLYGIDSEGKIEIINGATPLVTPDGEFAGCVIESGPQSMILLSEDRAVRKTVMQTLIHPYIEELCAIELKAKAESAAAHISAVGVLKEPQTENESAENAIDSKIPEIPIEEIKPETEKDEETKPLEETKEAEITEAVDEENSVLDTETDTETAEEAKTEVEAPADKPVSSFSTEQDGVTLEGGMVFETDGYRAADKSFKSERDSGLFIETKKPKKRRAEYYNDEYSAEPDDTDSYRNPHSSDRKPNISFNGNLPILIVSVLLLIILAVLCYCIFYVPAKNGISASAYLSETFNTLFG